VAAIFGVFVGLGVGEGLGVLVGTTVFVAVGSGVLVEVGVGWAAEVEQATDTKTNIKIRDKKGFRFLRCIYSPQE
jgi:hypothetical protein